MTEYNDRRLVEFDYQAPQTKKTYQFLGCIDHSVSPITFNLLNLIPGESSIIKRRIAKVTFRDCETKDPRPLKEGDPKDPGDYEFQEGEKLILVVSEAKRRTILPGSLEGPEFYRNRAKFCGYVARVFNQGGIAKIELTNCNGIDVKSRKSLEKEVRSKVQHNIITCNKIEEVIELE
jgi:hypothetical protein